MGKAERRARRAARKEARAIRKRAKGKNRRANKLEARAQTLRQKAGIAVNVPRVMVDTRDYSPTAQEVQTIEGAFARLRGELISNVRTFLDGFSGMSDAETVAAWNANAVAESNFGEIDKAKHFANFAKRVYRITNTLENRAIFIKFEDGAKKPGVYGSAMPSVLNRPTSKNVRFKIYLNTSGHDLEEMTGTIVHEIAHTIVLPSPDPSFSELDDQNTNQAFRTPRRYEAFFLNI